MDLILGQIFFDPINKHSIKISKKKFNFFPKFTYIDNNNYETIFYFDEDKKCHSNNFYILTEENLTRKYDFIPDVYWNFLMFRHSVIYFPAFTKIEDYIDNFYSYFSRKLVSEVNRKEVNDKIVILYISFNRYSIKIPEEMVELILSFIRLIDLI